MNKFYHFVLMLMCCFQVAALSAQENPGFMVAGTVMDEKGLVMPGVTVIPENNPGAGTVTDIDGKFRLRNLKAGQKIVFSFIGYKSHVEMVYKSLEGLKVIMNEEISKLDEVVVVGRGTQRKISVVGAVTTVDPKDLQVPSASVTNMLGGRVPGIIAVTRSGEPGDDFSEFWIRGISTFGANSSALVLIDGVEGNLNDLDPADIESFSILKDASATAVYGVRGANGVVVVTTKRGAAGKLKINFKTNWTMSENGREPDYVDAPTYARLANEARIVRGSDPRFSDVELALFESGLDPDLYPNVNWRDVILKDHTWNNQHYLSVSGGGENARYFLSAGIQNKDAVFKQDKSAHEYNTNVKYHKYTFRANIDANLTKTTVLSLGIDETIVKRNSPGYGDNNDALWAAQANLTPVTVPVRYSTGQLAAKGANNSDEFTPYVLLNYTGFKEMNRNTAKVNVNLAQDLNFITEGLSINGLFSFTNEAEHNVVKDKFPDVYRATERNLDGTLNMKLVKSKQDLQFNSSKSGAMTNRKYYWEARANYERAFGDHRVGGLIHYYMQGYSSSDGYHRTLLTSIPERYQALSGRFTYSFRDTYLVEGNVGYTGSENFEPGNQFGWFPAIAIGWVPSQYEWWKNRIPFIGYFKLRASVGQVGNDRLAENGNPVRFPYLTTTQGTGSGTWGGSGIGENQMGTDNLVWETATKYDVGIDANFFRDRFELKMDYFRDNREGIFQRRASIPVEAGFINVPFGNLGRMTSQGVDGTLSYTQNFVKDFMVTVRTNFTYAHNNVTYWEQADQRYPYQSYSGVPYGVQRGLIALGLFRDEYDVKSSPKQTFRREVLPGDIKYKDVNGDGVINADDEVPLSFSRTPEIQYGFALEMRWKKLTVSAFFEGTTKCEYFLGGTGYYPFAWDESGNVLEIVADQKNRWTPASYSGDPATENPNARFPRLTYGPNENNNRNSTFWLANASYLRLKNIDISYSFEHPAFKRVGIDNVSLSLVGDNLAVWDHVKLWDPGQASHNGAKYPLQRTYTLQLNIQF